MIALGQLALHCLDRDRVKGLSACPYWRQEGWSSVRIRHWLTHVYMRPFHLYTLAYISRASFLFFLRHTICPTAHHMLTLVGSWKEANDTIIASSLPLNTWMGACYLLRKRHAVLQDSVHPTMLLSKTSFAACSQEVQTNPTLSLSNWGVRMLKAWNLQAWKLTTS